MHAHVTDHAHIASVVEIAKKIKWFEREHGDKTASMAEFYSNHSHKEEKDVEAAVKKVLGEMPEKIFFWWIGYNFS